MSVRDRRPLLWGYGEATSTKAGGKVLQLGSPGMKTDVSEGRKESQEGRARHGSRHPRVLLLHWPCLASLSALVTEE